MFANQMLQGKPHEMAKTSTMPKIGVLSSDNDSPAEEDMDDDDLEDTMTTAIG